MGDQAEFERDREEGIEMSGGRSVYDDTPPWASEDYAPATGPQVVQVRILGAPRPYAYTWTGEPLAVGDWVELPGNEVSPDGCKGVVESFGRDGYKGVLRAVAGRIPAPPDVWVARMSVVKDHREARAVWRAALRGGIGGDRLARIVDAGTKRLKELGA